MSPDPAQPCAVIVVNQTTKKLALIDPIGSMFIDGLDEDSLAAALSLNHPTFSEDDVNSILAYLRERPEQAMALNPDFHLRNLVFSALQNAKENGETFERWMIDEIVDDLRARCSDCEDAHPAALRPYVKAWAVNH